MCQIWYYFQDKLFAKWTNKGNEGLKCIQIKFANEREENNDHCYDVTWFKKLKGKYVRCKGCRIAVYCSYKCFKNDWNVFNGEKCIMSL